MSTDKTEATRLADALENSPLTAGLPHSEQAAALLRRWPDVEPVGYLPAYELDRLRSGHDGWLRSAKFGPSALDGDIALYTAPPDQSERIAALEAENAKLLDAVADKVSAATMLTGMTTGPDGLRLALQGGAASLLAEMLAQQFKDGGGINYLELSFVSRKAAPGDAFVVTVQRVLGKTPHALRAEAEAKHAALEAALEQARVALEHIDLDARVARPYVGQVSRLGGIASAALRKIEEVQR